MPPNKDAKGAPSNPEVAQDPEPSYKACHKVLETVELLEMILLSLHGSQDMFYSTRDQHDNTVSLLSRRWDDDPTSNHSDGGLTYAYTQEEVRCNMTTLLLAQRVNHMFEDTIKGSIKLQRALWFAELEDNRGDFASEHSDRFPRINPSFFKRFATPVCADRIWCVSSITVSPSPSRRTLRVRFKRKSETALSGQPESWSRMLIAQSADSNVVPMIVYMPQCNYTNAIGGLVRRSFEVPETAGNVWRQAEESKQKTYLDYLRATRDKGKLGQEVNELKSKGGWLYDVAKANLEVVERELDGYVSRQLRSGF